MSDLTTESMFGNTERVFVFERSVGGSPQYVVRPAVVLVDGNQVRFRNFTPHRVRVEASFLAARSVDLAPRNSAGDRVTAGLGSPQPGFHEYTVKVATAAGDVEAVGDSRPGAIIDR